MEGIPVGLIMRVFLLSVVIFALCVPSALSRKAPQHAGSSLETRYFYRKGASEPVSVSEDETYDAKEENYWRILDDSDYLTHDTPSELPDPKNGYHEHSMSGLSRSLAERLTSSSIVVAVVDDYRANHSPPKQSNPGEKPDGR